MKRCASILQYGVGRGAISHDLDKGCKRFAFIEKLGQLQRFRLLVERAIIFIMAVKGKNLLIVEDDLFLATLLKNRMEKEGVNVSVAKDGDEAMTHIKVHKPDLILLDIILPGKSGFEFLEELRQQSLFKDIPIFIMSNLGQEDDIKRGNALGIAEYFIKSHVPLEEMIKKITAFLVS